MKQKILFLLFCLASFHATAQTIVDPSEFPTLSSPNMSNWAIYTREDKVNRKVLPAAIRALMLPTVRQPVDIGYTPAATGNASDRGSFVRTSSGRTFFIDGLGNSVQTNFPYAAATIADNDIHAGVMCVPVGGWYRLSNANTLGQAPGTLRQRVFGSLTPCTNAANPVSPGQTKVVGGAGIIKTNGDPDTNPYVKAQDQWYESSVAYDTVTRQIYTYNSAGSVGNRWNIFVGAGVDTRIDTAYISSDTLRLAVYDILGDSLLKTINVYIPPSASSGIDTIATYTALRAYTGNSLAVFVQDFGTTQGGLFRRVSTGTENGGTLIVATNGVKWKRQFDGKTFFPEYWQVGGYDETGASGGITDITERIQAAINMASAVGGTIELRKPYSPYSVIPKVANITISGGKGAVELKSNIRFVIGPGVVLQKANSAQTNATGGVSILYGDTLSNVWIGGGGSIIGNTANQPGWTLGYGQAGEYGSGIFIAQGGATGGTINSNITISGISITDHFSTASELIGIQKLAIQDYYWSATGEGLELQRCYNVDVNNISALGTGVEVGDGFETAGCTDVNVTKLFIKNWAAPGSAIDIYATKRCHVSEFIITGTGTQDGISGGSSVSPIVISENLSFNNGYLFNMLNGAYVQDADVMFSNITFDSCVTAINVTAGANPASANKNEVVISGCTFKNRATGVGILFDTNKRVFVQGCVFDEIFEGVSVAANATTLTPKAFITGCTFRKIGRYGVFFNDQSNVGYAPEGLVSGCSFTKMTASPVQLSGNTTHVRISEITLDSIYIYTTGTTSVGANFMYITAVSPSSITTLPTGTDGQRLTFVTNMAGGNVKTFSEGGNLLLNAKAPFSMVQACQITFKYSAILAKWIEISRTQAGDISDATTATLDRKYFLPDWSIENVGAASQTGVVVARLSSLDTYGQDFYVPLPGMVRRFGIISNTAISTGSVTANLQFNGGGPNGTVTLSGGQTTNTTSYGRYGKTFGANTFLGVTYTTSGTFNHPTADILVWMEIEY